MYKKAFLIILILLFLGLNYSYSQTKEKISLPVLQESYEIDSLINKVAHEHIFDYSSMMLSVTKIDNVFHFFIQGALENEIVSFISISQKKATYNFGYFEFKNFKIFVYDVNSFPFSNTAQFKAFSFIPDKWEPGFAWDYEYIKGHFSWYNPKTAVAH